MDYKKPVDRHRHVCETLCGGRLFRLVFLLDDRLIAEAVNGNLPDLGAHESGTERMRFGVKAQFVPPGMAESTPVIR